MKKAQKIHGLDLISGYINHSLNSRRGGGGLKYPPIKPDMMCITGLFFTSPLKWQYMPDFTTVDLKMWMWWVSKVLSPNFEPLDARCFLQCF